MQTSQSLCPVCGVRPPHPGFTHCGQTCAWRARAAAAPAPPVSSNNNNTNNNMFLGVAPPMYNNHARAASTGSLPYQPRRSPSPAPRRICPQCKVNTVSGRFQHCSKECALASRPAPAATPRKRITTCEYCKAKPAEAPYRYCSSDCVHEDRKVKALEDSMSALSVSSQSLRMCLIEGCKKTEWKAGSKYCGDRHRRVAVEKKLEPACLLCKEFPKMDRSAFCSAVCTKSATDSAPMLLSVPEDDPSFILVARQFSNEWKHTPTPPKVAFVYRVVTTAALTGSFQQKKQEIEQKHNFKADGLLEANERLRWHGTKRNCFVGDPGSKALDICSSSSCSICIIMKQSFDITHCKSGCMFGIGIYTSATSSKSDGYVRQSTFLPSKYRAMLLTRVLAGNAQTLTQADPHLKAPPPGFDSIRGVPGGGVPGVSLQMSYAGSSTSSVLCPGCGVKPPANGFRHCSRNCAKASTPSKPSLNPNPSSNSQSYSSPATPSRPPSAYTSSPAPTRSQLRGALCPVCTEKPPTPGFRHCSQDCALAEKIVKVADPINLLTGWLCEACGNKFQSGGYRYCSVECSRSVLSLESSMSKLSVGGSSTAGKPRKCIMQGCDQLEWKSGSKYCGDSCRMLGVILLIDPACLLCKKFPKMTRSLYCSASCANAASTAAPALLDVPDTHQAFQQVSDQFTREWKHTTAKPTVCAVYLVVLSKASNRAYEAKLAQIDRSHDFKAEKMFPANERRRWHGTFRECRVGDPGPNATTLCSSASCSTCVIMRYSFDPTRCKPGCMFGKGVYTSGTSSKSHGYAKQGTPSLFRAMFLTRVLAGRAVKYSQADPNLTRPPPGYDSVRGVPGTNLNYDELIVYDADAIRPMYLVIYR